MIYGYCRISTKKQSIERQERNILKEYKQAYIIKEVFTGTTNNRKEWQKLITNIKTGDTIIFDSVSRMSRNAEQGYKDYMNLYNKGVNLIFLKEKYCNTEKYKSQIEELNNTYKIDTNVSILDTSKQEKNAMYKFIKDMQTIAIKKDIIIAFEQSQKEVDDLSQRTKEGLITARLNGKQIGRQAGKKVITKKEKESKIKILELSKDFNGDNKDIDIIKMLGINRNTYYKYKRELQATKKDI